MSWETGDAWVKACTRKYLNMASDFQRPSNLMISESMRAQSRAVAPPGRRERAVSKRGSIPVKVSREAAAWRRPLVMNWDLT